MFLDYFALFLLCLSLTAVFYLFIFIHNLPYKIAKNREHPHEESIHVACWLSLFTFHALWPIVYIWAVSHKKGAATETVTEGELAARLAVYEQRLAKLETK